jgi:large subunit ribosomal protein L6
MQEQIMSRIGKKPIQLPEKVELSLNGSKIIVKGPKGSLERQLHPAIALEINDNIINVKTDTDNRKNVALQGLYRTLINNMVVGVKNGFEKKLSLVGIGYRAEAKGNDLILNIGYSNPITFKVPHGVTVDVQNNTLVTLSSNDKEFLGQVAATIREIRPPEPYKGKGIMYADERIIRKAGKTAGKK